MLVTSFFLAFLTLSSALGMGTFQVCFTHFHLACLSISYLIQALKYTNHIAVINGGGNIVDAKVPPSSTSQDQLNHACAIECNEMAI